MRAVRFMIRCLWLVEVLCVTFNLYLNRAQPLAKIFLESKLLLLGSVFLSGIFILFLEMSFSTVGVQIPPGSHLQNLAEFLFSRKTYEQVLEPTLHDLFDEYCEALNRHRPWKAGWVRIRGYWSFWSAVFAQMPISAVKMVYKIWQATR